MLKPKSMNCKKIKLSTLFLLFSIGGIYAQKNTSKIEQHHIDEIQNHTSSDLNKMAFTNEQEPYKIYIISGVEEENINLEISVYSDPVTVFLTLSVDSTASSFDIRSLSFKLFDNQNKMLEESKPKNKCTIIRMESVPSGNYFLKVYRNKNWIKTFEIIKN